MPDTNIDTTAVNVEQSLATLDSEGKAPETRLADAQMAYQLYKKMKDADMIRSEKRAKMQGIIDGNEPWTEEDTKRSGQGWRSKINPRTGEAIRDARKSAYFSLIEDAEAYVDIRLKAEVLKDYPQYQDEEAVDFGDIICEEHRKVNKCWPDFLFEMTQHVDQFVTWAVGNLYFPDEWDWRFKAARVGQFLVPDRTMCKLGDFEVCAVRYPFRVHELYDKIRTPAKRKASREAGWDDQLIEQILIHSVKMEKWNDRYQLGDFESWQQTYQNAEYYYDSVAPDIQVVHLLWKEFDGKISHGIVCEDESLNKTSTPSNSGWTPAHKGYLFHKIGRYDSWENCLVLFFSSFGNGTYHSVRGLAARIAVICWEEMKMYNATLDAGKLANSVMLQPNNQAHKTSMAISRFGPLTIVESGYNMIQQSSFRPDMSGSIAVLNLLDNTLNRNIGKYPADIGETDRSGTGAQTLNAIKAQEHKEVKLEEQEVRLYYAQITPLWKEQLRRLLNPKLRREDPGGEEAFAFREACESRRVPKEWLKFDNLEIEARSVIGPTSPMLRSLILGENLSRSMYFDERGKRNALRDATVALVGCRHADRYVTKASRNSIPTQEKSFASMENAILQTGSEVIVGADQNHVEHGMVHFAPLLQAVQMFQQQGGNIDAVKAAQLFQSYLGHEGGHLDYLRSDPAHQAEFKEQYATFMELSNVLKLLTQKAKQIQKQQQQEHDANMQALQDAQQGMTPDMVVKMKKVQGDLMLKQKKEDAMIVMKEAKLDADLARKDRQADAGIELKNRMAASGGSNR